MRHSLGIKDTVKKNSMLIVLLATMLLFQVLISSSGRGSLFAPANISNLISQNAYVVILASGMLLCILTGGNIDLSVGSVVALVGALAGTLIVNLHWNIYLSIVICLLAGLAIGAWQGFWIAYVRIPPFITTLAGMLLWRGVALLILNGLTISPFPAEYTRYFNSFLPNTEDGATIFSVTVFVGVVICLIYGTWTFFDRYTKKKKGYSTEPLTITLTKVILLSIAVLIVFSLLGRAMKRLQNFQVSIPTGSFSSHIRTWDSSLLLPPWWVWLVSTRLLQQPEPTMRWMPSAPASSAVQVPMAEPEPSEEQSSVQFSWVF